MRVILILLVLMAMGCTGKTHYVKEYQEAVQVYNGVVIDRPAQIENRFSAFFNRLAGNSDVDGSVRNLYAEKLYFNDTLHTSRHRETLSPYLQSTADRLDSLEVKIVDQWAKHNDLYIVWQMSARFNSFGRKVTSESIGMTHLRVNASGKIVLHQDYWDSVQGVYRHVPVLGNVLEQIRKSF